MLLGGLVYPWRGAFSFKAQGNHKAISAALGVEISVCSISFAAIWKGPAVIVVHVVGREVFRRVTTVDALIAKVMAPSEKKDEPEKTTPSVWVERTKRLGSWCVDHTDLMELPSLGKTLWGALVSPEMSGSIKVGFSDPELNGKAAAWLYSILGVIGPLGQVNVDIDWSGETVLDTNLQGSTRVIVARLVHHVMAFVLHHVHPFQRPPSGDAAAQAA